MKNYSRFFERIARTYRREKWETMLRPLLTAWYQCAQQMGDVDMSVRLLVEMLGHGYGERAL
jgi:trafficking protein particle complex subunit 11